MAAPKKKANIYRGTTFSVKYLEHGTSIVTTITVFDKYLKCPLTPIISFSTIRSIVINEYLPRSFKLITGNNEDSKEIGYEFIAKDHQQRNDILRQILQDLPAISTWENIINDTDEQVIEIQQVNEPELERSDDVATVNVNGWTEHQQALQVERKSRHSETKKLRSDMSELQLQNEDITQFAEEATQQLQAECHRLQQENARLLYALEEREKAKSQQIKLEIAQMIDKAEATRECIQQMRTSDMISDVEQDVEEHSKKMKVNRTKVTKRVMSISEDMNPTPKSKSQLIRYQGDPETVNIARWTQFSQFQQDLQAECENRQRMLGMINKKISKMTETLEKQQSFVDDDQHDIIVSVTEEHVNEMDDPVRRHWEDSEDVNIEEWTESVQHENDLEAQRFSHLVNQNITQIVLETQQELQTQCDELQKRNTMLLKALDDQQEEIESENEVGCLTQ